MTVPNSKFIRVLNDPYLSSSRLFDVVRDGKNLAFALSLGATNTSDIAGISAAGITPDARRLTPAVDAEALVLGRTVDGSPIPVSPAGIISPVVITRACLRVLQIEPIIIDCGTFVKPKIECRSANARGVLPARCLSTGDAIDETSVKALFDFGCALGNELGNEHDTLALAECVPGGTTTAMAVLTALGFDVRNLLSSSLPISNHNDRFKLVELGLQKAALNSQVVASNPLLCVARVGDPMQAVVAGMVATASQRVSVFLCGGSQMIAVFALTEAILKAACALADGPGSEQNGDVKRGRAFAQLENFRHNTLVMTTKWVALDETANMQQLARLTNTPFACSCPDFAKSRHAGLNAYEQGNVKEGVGAGGAMAMAHLSARVTDSELMNAIDECYDELVVMQPCTEVASH